MPAVNVLRFAAVDEPAADLVAPLAAAGVGVADYVCAKLRRPSRILTADSSELQTTEPPTGSDPREVFSVY